jgi:hypothetical protein
MAGALATKTQKTQMQFKLRTPEDPKESGQSSSAAVVVPCRKKKPMSGGTRRPDIPRAPLGAVSSTDQILMIADHAPFQARFAVADYLASTTHGHAHGRERKSGMGVTFLLSHCRKGVEWCVNRREIVGLVGIAERD